MSNTEWKKDLTNLKAGIRGDALQTGDADYDQARRIFNGMIDRHPAVIVRCATATDVVHAVNFAREHSMTLSVRSGGHGVAGTAICDDGLVVDLTRMRAVRVDLDRRTVWAQAGASWADVDRETQLVGLATPGGFVSGTGVAGFTLGGGIAWLSREFGLACDNLVAAEVITADGRYVQASADSHPDLFWGLRGGGGNFGVVTGFEFRLHPVGPVIVGGLVLYPWEQASKVARFFVEWLEESPEQLNAVLVAITAPPLPFVPADHHGKKVVGILAFCNGPVDRAKQLLAPLHGFGQPIADLVGPLPYTVLQSLGDAANPMGHLNYWKSQYLTAALPEALETFLTHAARAPSPLSECHFQYVGGAVARVPADSTAFGHRDAPWLVNIVGKWSDPKDTDENTRWVRDMWSALRPFGTGASYVNFTADSDEAELNSAYSARLIGRLAEVKGKYDPDNLFRMNLNVRPLRARAAPLP